MVRRQRSIKHSVSLQRVSICMGYKEHVCVVTHFRIDPQVPELALALVAGVDAAAVHAAAHMVSKLLPIIQHQLYLWHHKSSRYGNFAANRQPAC